MKRYLAFGGDSYYPTGGWMDFSGAFATITEAQAAVAHCDWWHVIDGKTGKAVAPPEEVTYFEQRELRRQDDARMAALAREE